MTLRIQVASDLHLEHIWRAFPGQQLIRPEAGADVLVLAGDIAVATAAVYAFADWPVPVLYVPGNHEHYQCPDFRRNLEAIRKATYGTAVQVLERDEVTIQGVRFLGATLWTDYALDGEEVRPEVMEQARLMMVDHRMIGKGFAPNGPIEFFGPEDALQEHLATRAWLTQRLAGSSGPAAARTVVITHHAPHPSSIHARFAGDSLNPAFVTDLTPLMEGVNLWIHGHVHNTFDYQVQRCRVVANPRGYPLNLRARPGSMSEVKFENPEFIPNLVLEV